MTPLRLPILLPALALLLLAGCAPAPAPKEEADETFYVSNTYTDNYPELTLEQANNLANLPLSCVQQEYPNKLGQTLATTEAIGEPSALHPAFYGCFDWHSAVHGHWSLVALLKQFPNLARAQDARVALRQNLSAANIRGEVAYFKRATETSYERTYGWAWLLQLDAELAGWDDPLAAELRGNLAPLTGLIVERYRAFLPKLLYPIRTGEHPNTAFGLAMAHDYAVTTGAEAFRQDIEAAARRFYVDDQRCPLNWEPSGYDFLSPCLEEVDLMRRVLPVGEFHPWFQAFLPQFFDPHFQLEVGRVGDRNDGKLVHLDGLNFSRAWVIRGLADQYPNEYGHLIGVATQHVEYSLPNLVGDSYDGGHWLGSFAIYALR